MKLMMHIGNKYFIAIGFVCISCIFYVSDLFAQPVPPPGYRWEVNPLLSDEFNGGSLDASKWYDYNPTWAGRPPAKFMPSSVSVRDGYMRIRNDVLDPSQGQYNLAGGAVCAKNNGHYGYYECNMKASKISMSSTFWFSNTNQSTGTCTYASHEIDVQEAIGAPKTSDPGRVNFMKSNTHYKHKPCDSEAILASVGGSASLSPQVSDAFHAYGCWWVDPNTIHFYLDGEYRFTIKPSTLFDDTPFDRPMRMNMVTETYDWETPPTVDEVTDTNINTTFYNYVRSYFLVKLPERINLMENPGFETGDLSGWSYYGGTALISSEDAHSGDFALKFFGSGGFEQVVDVEPGVTYTLSGYGKTKGTADRVYLGVKDYGGTEKSVLFDHTDFTEESLSFTCGQVNSTAKIYLYIPGAGVEAIVDAFVLVSNSGAADSVKFRDPVAFMLRTDSVSLDVDYKAAGQRDIYLQLEDPDGIPLDSSVTIVDHGAGSITIALKLDYVLPVDSGYRFILSIRPPDGGLQDIINTDTVRVDILDPVSLSVSILNDDNGEPIPGAVFSLGALRGTTNQEGNLTLSELPPGEYLYSAVATHFYSLENSEIILKKDTSMSLRLAPRVYKLTFTILEKSTGMPVKSATLSLDGKDLYTNSEGRVWDLKTAGSYPYRVSMDKFYLLEGSVDLQSDTTIYLMLVREFADLDFIVYHNSSRISGVMIIIMDISKKTLPLGTASFDALPADTALTYTMVKEGLDTISKEIVLHTDTSITVNMISTLSEELSVPERIGIYPNPASERISMKGFRGPASCRITDLSGRTVILVEISSGPAELDISGLLPGLYILGLRTGQEVFREMIRIC